MNNIQAAINKLSEIRGARFVSFEYTSKSRGETARYTLAMGVDYVKACEADILELELRLPELKGIEAVVTRKQIESLRESINAKAEGREHVDYRKKNIYVHVCPGVKVNTKDGTFELCGFQHAKRVLTPGDDKNAPMSQEARARAKVRASIKTGSYRTLCFDLGHAHKLRVNGDEVLFDS